LAGSTTFGGTIELGGEKEYRQAVTHITNELKVLGSEMGILSNTYDKNNQSIEGYTKKNELLTEQIEKQKEKSEALRTLVAEMTQKYGENSNATLKWQTELNKSEATVAKLENSLEQNNKALEKAKEEEEENTNWLSKFSQETKKASEETKIFGATLLANLASEAVKASISAINQAISGFTNYVKQAVVGAADYGDSMLNLAAKTGLSTESVQKFSAVSDVLNVDMSTISSTLTKLNTTMLNAKDGTSTAAKAFSTLGVSVTDSNGSLLDNEAVFWSTIESLRNMSNETERDALAMQVLGKSALELQPFLALSNEELENITNTAYSMGAVLSEQTLNSLQGLDNQFAIFGSTMSATSNIIGAIFAPAMTQIMTSANDVGGALNEVLMKILNGDDDLDASLEKLKESFKNLALTIIEKTPEFLELGATLLSALGEALWDAIKTQFEGFIPWLKQWGVLVGAGLIALALLIPPAISAIGAAISAGLAILGGIVFAWPAVLIATVVGLLIAFWPQISKVFGDWGSKIKEIGGNLIKGLWEGISNVSKWIMDKIKGFCKGVLDGIKSLFGIKSPSRVFRDMIGKNLALGIGEGFEDEMSEVSKQMGDAIPTDFDIDPNITTGEIGSLERESNKNINSQNGLIRALQSALTGMSFKVDGDKFGELIVDNVEKVVYS